MKVKDKIFIICKMILLENDNKFMKSNEFYNKIIDGDYKLKNGITSRQIGKLLSSNSDFKCVNHKYCINNIEDKKLNNKIKDLISNSFKILNYEHKESFDIIIDGDCRFLSDKLVDYECVRCYFVNGYTLIEYITVKKRDRVVGVVHGSKNTLTGIVDVAMVQSLSSKENVDEILSSYGMVIMDDYEIIGLSQEAA